MSPHIEGGDVVEPLGERVLGRVIARDVFKPGSDEVIMPAGTLIDEKWVDFLEVMSVDEVVVRSPITCETRHGICAIVLRPRPGPWPSRQHRRGGRCHRCPVHR